MKPRSKYQLINIKKKIKKIEKIKEKLGKKER